MANELTQVQWQALIDAARECKRHGTNIRNEKVPVYGTNSLGGSGYPEGNDNSGVSGITGRAKEYNLIDLLIKAVVDATTQLAASTNVNGVTAIAANTFTDG
jgi:hypothetical protein